MKRVWIGTSGWSYQHWREVFYPPEVKPNRFLEFYARYFDCAELNASFYRLPKPETVSSWLQRTPDYFRFCAKLHRLITHQKKLNNVQEPLAQYFQVFQVLEERLGPILIQLPPSLRFEEARVRGFLELLRTHYGTYQFALEARHKSWLTETALNLLREFQVAWTIAHSDRFPYHEAVTAPFIYLRFHGPGRLYASNYPEEMLQPFAQKIAHWVNQGLAVWAFFNNDVGGYAVKNALTLRNQVEALIGTDAVRPARLETTI